MCHLAETSRRVGGRVGERVGQPVGAQPLRREHARRCAQRGAHPHLAAAFADPDPHPNESPDERLGCPGSTCS